MESPTFARIFMVKFPGKKYEPPPKNPWTAPIRRGSQKKIKSSDSGDRSSRLGKNPVCLPRGRRKTYP